MKEEFWTHDGSVLAERPRFEGQFDAERGGGF